ncbi:hypothetical protein OG883_15920 [Streptomyces sp. NBC_01142]|uniref:hypothetical protein n=1 Tax=Streptomyces sp. NBC_01142 TaxID=2975865 RepID=UPI002257D00A|nr:hypothetical protein [Streptomyces sp. NBC_01142]MCX4821366.1 hypothetical protein [Streptomyces sp. NBC_01142]
MASQNETDEDAVRRALRMIGGEAGRADPGSAPAQEPVSLAKPRRRRRVVAVSLAAAAAAAAACIAVTVSVMSGSSGPASREEQNGQGQTLAEWIACARTIAVGDVSEVRPSSKGRITVGLDVADWIKPSHGDSRITLDLVDPRVTEARPPIEKGQHLLMVVPERSDQETSTFEGAELTQYRSTITKALGKAEHTACPHPWRQTS